MASPRSIMTVSIGVWLILSVILSNAFTGILLKTYFKIENVPIIKSLEDIDHNKDISVAGISQHLLNTAKLYNFDLDDIIKRVNNNPDNLPNPLVSVQVAEKVVNAKSTIILNSVQRSFYLDIMEKHRDRLYVSEYKYLPEYMALVINKNKEFVDILSF